MFSLLTLPTQARQAAPIHKQGWSSSADPRFTFHASPFTSLDDPVFEQIMQMHNPDNSLGLVCNDKRGNGVALHHFDRLGCQLIRPDQLGPARGQRPGGDLREIPALLEKAPQVAVGNHPKECAGSIDHCGHTEFLHRHFENSHRA
jgi:hypothetical protein